MLKGILCISMQTNDMTLADLSNNIQKQTNVVSISTQGSQMTQILFLRCCWSGSAVCVSVASMATPPIHFYYSFWYGLIAVICFLQWISRHLRCPGHPALHMHFRSLTCFWTPEFNLLLIHHSSAFVLWNKGPCSILYLIIRRYPHRHPLDTPKMERASILFYYVYLFPPFSALAYSSSTTLNPVDFPVSSLLLTRRRWFWLGGISEMPIKQLKN